MTVTSRKVNLVRLHATYHVSGPVGQIGPVLENNPSIKSLTYDMTKVEGGVLVFVTKNGASAECFIPDGNCTGMTLVPQPDKLSPNLKMAK